MKVRFAKIEDSNDILSWRNDPVSRKNFKDSSILSIESHTIWFKNKLESDTARLIIAEKEEEKIGVTRFEIIDDSVLVSINLNPDSRGKGYGSRMLLLSEEILDFRITRSLYKAEILKNNFASIKIFEKSGYALESLQDSILIYTKSIK